MLHPNLEAVPGKAGEEVVPDVDPLEAGQPPEDAWPQLSYPVAVQVHYLQRVLERETVIVTQY